jgi:hypothetical protein
VREEQRKHESIGIGTAIILIGGRKGGGIREFTIISNYGTRNDYEENEIKGFGLGYWTVEIFGSVFFQRWVHSALNITGGLCGCKGVAFVQSYHRMLEVASLLVFILIE